MIIDGKETAKKIRENIVQEVSLLDKKPGIAVVIVGNDPSSKIYVNNKKKAAINMGMYSEVIEFDENIPQQILENKIEELNNDKDINGILVQIPLPEHIKAQEVIEKIKPEKDVDGLHPLNIGRAVAGIEPFAYSCTPYGIIKLLETYNISIEGKHAVIVGRSNLVGKPLSTLFLKRNATVTICHSKTKNLKEITKQADILVSAVGVPLLIKEDFVKDGAVAIDVGITRMPDGKLIGDMDFENIKDKVSFITPVPGGVGPMTITMLLYNTLRLYKIQNGELEI